MNRALLSIGVSALVGLLSVSPSQAQESIKIGVPLELSGRFVAFGTAGKRGAEMAVDAFKGRVHGLPVELLFRDVQSDPQVTVTVMNELMTQRKVNYLFGPIASAIVSAAIPAWRQTKPVWIEHGSTSPQLEVEVGKEPRFFHTFPYSYHYQETLARTMREALGPGKTAVIIYSEDTYGRAALPAARSYYTAAGFKIASELLVRTNATDYNPVLSRVRAANPDVAIALLQTTDLANLAKQIAVAGLEVPYLTDGIDVLIDEWQKAVGPAQQGWIGVSGFLPDMNRPASKQHPELFPSLADWERTFRDRYHAEPAYLDAGAYSAMIMLLLALDKVGDDPDKVTEALAAIDTDTLLGRGRFIPTPSGTLHQAFQDLMVVQRQSGKNVIVSPADVATGTLVARKPQ